MRHGGRLPAARRLLYAAAMSYVVLARKYRPPNLAALVGQGHIARALGNAIRMDRVAHALLFCGARGTGKTSTARIVAKMLNCTEGPTETPCGTCAACTEIATGTSIDVHELDAASNRGINEIRELREGVGYAPARDRHKVYIIDEAHMLTNEAANAFLKTLEEPPSHVIFILATTDPQRLPVTIRSRCQRYDFRRIRSAEVVSALAAICAQEKVVLDEEALYLVAREGDGSMRDSLSVLDQVIAFGGEDMNAAEVASLLGVADRNRTASLMQALVERDTPTALQAVGAAHSHGMDLRTFARTLAQETRDLLVVRLSGKAARDLVDRAETEIEALAALARDASTGELERLAHVMLELAESVATARHPRLVLEMGVVRLCQAPALLDVAELAVRVEGLLTGGGGGGGGGARRASPAAPARPRSTAPAPGGLRERGPTPRAQRDDPSAEALAPPVDDAPPRGAARTAAALIPTQQAEAEAPLAASAPVGPRGRSLRDEDLETWQRVLTADPGHKVIASLLNHAVVHSSGPGRVELAFANAFHARQAAEPEHLEPLCEAAGRAFGGAYVVEIGGVADRARTDSVAARRERAQQAERDHEIASLVEDPLVRRVMAAFGGTLTHTISEQELTMAGTTED